MCYTTVKRTTGDVIVDMSSYFKQQTHWEQWGWIKIAGKHSEILLSAAELMWGCGRRQRFLVWIIFFPILYFQLFCLYPTHFLRNFCLREFGNILDHTKKASVTWVFTICSCQLSSWADLNLCDNVRIFLKDLFSSRKYTPVKISVAWKFVHKSQK